MAVDLETSPCISTVRALLKALRRQGPPRDVYKGADGNYWITYDGDQVSAAALHEAIAGGDVAETYPDKGAEFWRVPELVGAPNRRVQVLPMPSEPGRRRRGRPPKGVSTSGRPRARR